MSEGYRTMDGETSHARLMDETYSVQRHFYDLTRPMFLYGRDRLINGLDAPPGSTILEVGCGTARNLIRSARRWPGTRLYGVDISGAMLETAQRSIDRHGLSDRIHLMQGDAGMLDVETSFGLEEVDRVYFSYTLSMMPPWREALGRAAAILSPGGSMHVVDFGRYERLPSILRWMHFTSLGLVHVHPRDDMLDVLKGLADGMDLRMEATSLYRGNTQTAVLRRP